MRHSKTQAIAAAFLSALAFGCDTPSGLSPEATGVRPSFEKVHNQFFFPVAGDVFHNPCPPEELVLLVDGHLHLNEKVETLPDGTTEVKAYFNSQGIEGVGLTTGQTYRQMDNDRVEVLITETSFGLQSTQRFRLIREGSLDNLWVRATILVQDGDETVMLDGECRG